MEPLVSVLMAVGPGAGLRWLLDAVESVRAQSFRDWEMVIVFDGARPGGIVGFRSGRDDRIRDPIWQEHAGLAASLNRAASLARGQVYARMDADDVCHPDRLRRQVEAMDDLDVLGTWAHQIGTVSGVLRYPVGHAEIVAAMRRRNPLCHSTVMMRREAFWTAGGYDPTWTGPGQDWDLWHRMARAGAQFATLPEPLLHYRRHGDQVSAGWRGRVAAWSGRLNPLLRVPGQRSH